MKALKAESIEQETQTKQLQQEKEKLAKEKKSLKMKETELQNTKKMAEAKLKELEESVSIVSGEERDNWTNLLKQFVSEKQGEIEKTIKQYMDSTLSSSKKKESIEQKFNEMIAKMTEKVRAVEGIEEVLRKNGSNRTVVPIIIAVTAVISLVAALLYMKR